MHVGLTLLPGTTETLEKLYERMALETVNWAMAVRDHKRQGREQFLIPPVREENLIMLGQLGRSLEEVCFSSGEKCVPNETLLWSCRTHLKARLKGLPVSK